MLLKEFIEKCLKQENPNFRGCRFYPDNCPIVDTRVIRNPRCSKNKNEAGTSGINEEECWFWC